jgi:hypothetical protein
MNVAAATNHITEVVTVPESDIHCPAFTLVRVLSDQCCAHAGTDAAQQQERLGHEPGPSDHQVSARAPTVADFI